MAPDWCPSSLMNIHELCKCRLYLHSLRRQAIPTYMEWNYITCTMAQKHYALLPHFHSHMRVQPVPTTRNDSGRVVYTAQVTGLNVLTSFSNPKGVSNAFYLAIVLRLSANWHFCLMSWRRGDKRHRHTRPCLLQSGGRKTLSLLYDLLRLWGYRTLPWHAPQSFVVRPS